jgi:pentose-5-phosphate-3-epimerase
VTGGVAHLSGIAARHGVRLSGSLIAVPPPHRPALARELADHGCTVHLDVIEGRYRGQAGVSMAEVEALTDAAALELDVHLMVDDLAEALERLAEAVARGTPPARITLQVEAGTDLQVAADRARALSRQVWAATHAAPPDAAALRAAGVDGVLVMLTPPGQPGHRADLGRLGLVTALTGRGMATGVDGGVDADNLARVAAAGAGYAVAGRALVGRAPAERVTS